MPYALENGAFGAFAAGRDWEEEPWIETLKWARLSGQCPLWCLVPDVVADRAGTLERWRVFAPRAAEYGWPLGFAVQDGMTPRDVPADAAVVFVGGSTTWKWRTMRDWCRDFPRVHVGRVNGYKRPWECHDAGAESCDGSGWTRGDQRQWRGLVSYLEESTSGRRIEQLELLA